MDFNKIKTSEYDTNKMVGGYPEPLPNGWYLVKIIKESEEKPSSNDHSVKGQLFTLSIAYEKFKNRTVDLWFTTSSDKTSDVWKLNLTEAVFIKIAKVCGIKILRSTEQLHNIAFGIYLTQKEQKKKIKEPDDETGEIKEREIKMIYTNLVGELDKIILSSEDFQKMIEKRKNEESGKRFIKKKKTEEENEEENEDYISNNEEENIENVSDDSGDDIPF